MVEQGWCLTALIKRALILGAVLALVPGASAAIAQPARTASRSPKAVVACLKKTHLQSVFRSSSTLWDGWDPKAGGFVYVQAYTTKAQAVQEARFLKALETGLAGTLVISQHSAPYKGSPVPRIVKCLGGRMISKAPSSGPGVYKF